MITLNLLPSKEKRNLYLKKVNWLLRIYAGQFLIALFIFALLLGLIWFFLSSQIKIVDKELGSYEVGVKKEALLELNQKIAKANLQISAVEQLQKEHQYYSLLLEEIITLIPAGARLENINIQKQAATKKEPAKNKIALTGYAPVRNNVLQIKEGLEKSIYFTDIESPLSNFVKATDINFNFSGIIKEEELKK